MTLIRKSKTFNHKGHEGTQGIAVIADIGNQNLPLISTDDTDQRKSGTEESMR